MSTSKTGFVALVGAGPGHPGLITLRAVELLGRADLVLYDKLVAAPLLEHAPPHAVRLCVTELGPCHAERITPVHETLIAAAREGKRVVRLKGGDPLLFGRGAEEAEALRRAGIPFEIVPGVTAALGAAAFAGIPLTHRACASGVAIVTGHEQPDKADALDWPALARFPGTLVFYMGMARLDEITQALLDNGKARQTPAAVVQWATLGGQRTVEAPLVKIAGTARAAGLTAPAITIIGPVVALRESLAWFEQLPLFGTRVLVTRPRGQSGAFVDRLVECGATAVVLPTVEIGAPADWQPVDDAIRRLGDFHWLVFTSANGVAMLLERLPSMGRDLRALGGLKLAAIGPKTAEALKERGLTADLVPARYQSEDLAAALKEAIAPGQRVLLARADRGRDVLREELSQHAQVEQVGVYSQVDAAHLNTEVLDSLRRGEIDYITVTSGNVARSLLERLDDESRRQITSGRTRLVTISPVTSAEVAAQGFSVACTAKEATMEGVLAALIDDRRAARR